MKLFAYFKAKKVKIFSFLSFLFLSTKIFSQQNCSVNLVSNQYVCQGSNATITANTSGMGQNPNFSWMVNGNQNQSNNDSITIQINGNNPTTVICTASNNNNNCNDSDTIQIYSINPGTIANNQYVCNGSIPITINSTNGGSTNIPNTSFSYQWYSSPNQNGPWTIIPNETNASFTPGPTQTTIYFRREFTLTVNGVNYTCYSNTSSVTNIPPPTINNPLCVNLNSNAQLTLTFNPSLPNGVTATYTWTGPNNFTSASSSPTVNSITAIKTGTYNVSVAISWNGSTLCTYQLSTTVNLNPATPTFNIPANGCQGNAYTPSNFNPAPNTTYQWNISPQIGSGGSTGLNTANPSFVFSNIGTYSITVTATQNGCSSTSTTHSISMYNFTIDPPTVAIGQNYYNVQVINGQNTIAICAGLSNTSINLINNNVAPYCSGGGCNPPGVTYTYSINNSAPAPFNSQVQGNIVYGNNPLIITASYSGCTMTYNVNIYSGSNPFVSLGTNNSIGLCPGDTVAFSINPVSPSGALNPPGTTYTVTGTDISGISSPSIWSTLTNLTSTTTISHLYNSTSCGTIYQNNIFPNNTFFAQVVAQNLCGQTTSSVSPVTVNAYPTASFTVSDSTICNNQSITVTNTGNSGSIIGLIPPYTCAAQGKFYWTITGGVAGVNYNLTSGTLGSYNPVYQNPNGTPNLQNNGSNTLGITFLSAGYYTITQNYYNSCGNRAMVRNICVINPAVCQFNTNPVSGCSPLTVSTNNTSTAPTCNGSPVPLSYVWTVSNQGAGTTAVISNTTAQNPNLTLTNNTAVPQVFTVSLNVIPMEPAAPNLPFSRNLLFCPLQISGSPLVGSIAGANSPWTAVVSGLSGAAGIPAGTYITATNGTGSIGTGGVYTVSSSTTSSINYSAAGGNPPLAGTVTNLLRAISGSVTAPTNLGNGSWSTTITGLCSTAGITVGSIITATNVLSGSLGSGICTVTAVGPNSITVTSTGGSSPTVGTITNLSVTTCTALCTQTVNVNPIPIFTPTSITTCNSPYSTNVNLQSLTNIPATFTWQATDNTNITGESTTQQNTSSIQDILTNNSNVAQTITYNVTPTSTPITAPGCVGVAQPISVSINTIIPGTISSNQTICAGGDPSILTGTNPIGIGNPTFQWQSSLDSINWTNIGSTTPSYDPPPTNIKIYYRRIVTYSSNNVNCQGISNVVTITVNSVSAGTISSPQTLCQGGDPNLIGIATNPTGIGALSYQWLSSPTGLNNTWTPIFGQNTTTYDPPILNSNTYYQLMTTSILNGITCTAVTQPLSITIVILNNGSIQSNQTICVGGDPTPFTSAVATSNNGAGISYQWQSSLDNVTWNNIVGAIAATYDPPVQNDTIWYRRFVTASLGGNVICSGYSNTLQIIVINDPIITTPPLVSQTICQGGVIQALTFSYTGGSGAPAFQWYSSANAGGPWAPISGATQQSYTPNAFNNLGNFYYSVVLTQSISGCSTGHSPAAHVSVMADPNVTNLTGASYCQNAAVVVPMSVTATNGIASGYTYQWFSNLNNNTTTGTPIAGANSSTYTPSVSNTGNVYYYCVVTQPGGIGCSVTTNTALISVTAGPSINNQPLASQTICVGGTLSALNISYTGGSGAATYQWYSNVTNSNIGGVAILNAISSSYTPPITANAGTYYYYCQISFGNNSGCSLITSNVSTIIVLADPVISTPPASQSICVGGTVSPALTVAITGGTGNPTYQWYIVNGGNYTPIQNANSSTYTPPVFNNLGNFNYSVIVNQNGSGCSTGQSSTAVITVGQDPIVSAPTGATYCQNAGNVSALSVNANGGNNTGMLYQWYSTASNNNSSGTAINGATSATYTPPVSSVGTLYYYCVVSQLPSQNNCATNSAQTAIIVNPGPSFSTQPNPLQSVCVNGTLSPLVVAVSGGNGVPSYQWYSNNTNNNSTGTIIPNATSASYTLPAATQVGTTYYYCIITFAGASGCASVISNLAQVNVSNGPSITTQPLASQTICVGGTISPALTVAITGGAGNPLYQWYTVNGANYTPIQNANSSTYTPPVFNSAGIFNYAVVVNQSSGGCSTGYSTNATVNVVTDPSLTAPTPSTSYCQNAGNVQALSVTASGGNGMAYTYQWYSNTIASTNNSVPIPNATSNSYTPPVNSTGTFYYYCVVTQGIGIGCSFSSSFAAVTVTAGPIINNQPLASQTICVGGTLSALNISYTGGSGAATYQWFSNANNSNVGGTIIPNATSNTYTPPITASAGTYYYYCEISFGNNSGCSLITSNVSTINVLADPVISTAPASQSICVGGTVSPALTVAISGGSGNATYQWYSVPSVGVYNLINGATNSSYTPPVFNNPGNFNYSVIVNQNVSGCSTGQSASAVISVGQDPIVSAPTGATYCQNAGNVNALSVSASGGNNTGMLYQWYSSPTNSNSGGTLIPNATASTYIPSTTNIGTIYYYCIVSQSPPGNNCATNSTQAAITITSAPAFSTQPIANQTICTGGAATNLTVAYSSGSGIPSYQWYSNNINANNGGSSIAGAINPTYTPSTQTPGTFYYYCVLTFAQSGCSTITSNVATVTVNPGPSITTQPTASQSICVGGTLATPLSVSFTNGVGAASYQWYAVNGATNTILNGATSNTYNPPAFGASGSFNYMVQITLSGGGCGSIQSNIAQVNVALDPTVTAPTGAAYCNGFNPVTPLSINAGGGNPNVAYTYQWFSNPQNNTNSGTAIAGATTNTYTPANNANGTLYYYCVVSQTPPSSGCQNTSNTAAIVVSASPTISVQPIANQTACIGGILSALTMTISGGSGIPTYQWYSNSVNSLIGSSPIGGATNPTYLPPSNQAGTTYYYCIISFPALTCSSITTSIVSVLIHPDPSISIQPIASQAVCTGTTINTPLSASFTGGFGVASYQWNINNGATNTPINGATSATFTPSIFNQAGTYNYSVSISLSGNGCGTILSAPAQIVVSPVPTVNSVSSVTYCNADITTAIPFSGTPAGVSFTWQNSNVNIGLASSGNGNLPSFTAANMSSNAIVGTITVTPQLTTLNTTCSGNSTSFTITINPYQNVNDPQDLVLCHGTGVNGIQFSGTAAINNWTNDLPALGIGASGSGTLPAFLAVNNGIAPIVAHLSVTPSFNGITTCPGDIETFTITILPAPTVSVPGSQLVCGGTYTNTINFTGTATSYQWTNNQPSIGLAASGTGNIPAFLANATGSNVVANIVVTPVYTFSGLTCTGNAQTTQITVIPSPSMNPLPNQVFCNNAPTGTVNIMGNATSFPWTTNNPSIGIASSGVGSIPSFNAINNTSSPVISLITVTPTNTFNGLTCTSPVQSFSIIVNPTPTMNSVPDQYICDQTNASPVVFSGNATGYLWTNSNGTIGLGNSGSGNIPAFPATNIQAIPVTANVSVIPTYTFQGVTCNGPIELFTITVLPTPQMSAISNQTVCSGTSTNAINFVGSGTNYIWSNNTPSIGLAGNGTGNISSFIAVGGNILTNATINVIPVYTFNNVSCYGSNQSGTITVLPIPSVNQPPNLVLCNNTNSGNIVFTGNATSLSWSNPNPSIGLSGNGTGNIASFITINGGVNQTTTPITLIPGFSQSGLNCVGTPISFNIVINPTPTVNLSNDIAVCHQNQTVPLNFSGTGTTYAWTNSIPAIGLAASGTGNIVPFTAINNSNTLVTSLVIITPQITQSGLTCTGPPDSLNINVEPIPSIQYSALSQTICSGTSTAAITLNSSYALANLTWSITSTSPSISGIGSFSGVNTIPNMTIVNSSSNPIQINYQGTATTPLAACTSTGPTGTITINPAPVISNINDTTICNNDFINYQLNANINSTFIWGASNNPNVIGESTGPITSSTIYNVLQNTSNSLETVIYTVTPYSTPQGCAGANMSFSVDIVPDIVVTNPLIDSVCSGDATGIYLTSNLPANFTWQAVNNPNVSGETTSLQSNFFINDFLVNNTVYDQIVDYHINLSSGTYACFGIPSVLSVVVHPAISLTNANALTICSGDNIGLVLAATVNSYFNWSAINNGIVTGESLTPQNNAFVNDILINNSTTPQIVNYIVDAISIDNGCSEPNLPLTVTVNPLPFIFNQDTTICSGQAVNMNIITSIPSNSNWYAQVNPLVLGETTTITNSGIINDVLVNTAANPSVVDYVISANASGCSAPNVTVSVTVLVQPDVSFIVNTNPLCSDAPISFINQSSPNYQFLWDFGNGATSNQYSPTHLYTNSGYYMVVLQGTDQTNNCSISDSLLLQINKSPDATFSTNDTIGCDELNSTFFSLYQPNVIYLWDFGNGETSSQVGNVTNYYNTEGCYTITLTLTSTEGCINQSSQSDLICVYDSPIANISADPLEVNSLDPQIHFYNQSQNAISYLWDLGNGTLSYDDNPVYTYPNWAANYNVVLTAYNEIGCIDTASISIHVFEDLIVYIPNSFTPNGDEANQLFFPVLAQGVEKEFIDFKIFNRWGELVFESFDPSVGWDGTFGNNGRDCQIGTYTWVITVQAMQDQDAKQITGHVNLIR